MANAFGVRHRTNTTGVMLVNLGLTVEENLNDVLVLKDK